MKEAGMFPAEVLNWLREGSRREVSITWLESSRSYRIYVRCGQWHSINYVTDNQVDQAKTDILGLVFEKMSKDIDEGQRAAK